MPVEAEKIFDRCLNAVQGMIQALLRLPDVTACMQSSAYTGKW